jgi:copper chaperone
MTMEHVSIEVRGMTCQGCVASVTRVLQSTPGVTGAKVDLASARADVDYDPARTSAAALKDAIEDAGYDVGDAGHGHR